MNGTQANGQMKALFRMAACDRSEEEYHPDFLSAEKVEKVRAFHYAFPMYQPIPWHFFANDSAAGTEGYLCERWIQDTFSARRALQTGKTTAPLYGMESITPCAERIALKGSHYKKPCAETAHGFLLAGNQSFRIDWA